MIPELLSYPCPIGFDTIYYAWRIKEGIMWTHWSGVFGSWLLYGMLIPPHGLLSADPFLLLKLTMPLLFGLNSGGVYYVATNVFDWSTRKSLFAAGLFSFQVAALGISWHFYRNMLGLGLLLFTLPWIAKKELKLRSLVQFSVLSILVTLSHEYSAVLLFACVLGIVVSNFRSQPRTLRQALRILASVSSVAVVFIGTVYFRAYPLAVAEPEAISALHMRGHYSGPLFFATNYLEVLDTVQYYPTYFDLFASVTTLFLVLYGALLPVAIVGFFRNKVSDLWASIACIGAFGCLVTPFCALDYWNRWMFMLVFPLTYYAANGFVKILQSSKAVTLPIPRLGLLGISKRTAKGLVLMSVVSGFVFMTSPMFYGVSGVFGIPTTVVYLPTTMLCNTVPLNDVDSVIEALQWVNTTMNHNSCFLAHDAFYHWAKFSLDKSLPIVLFKDSISRAVDLAVQRGYTCFWLLWWSTNIGWYDFDVPNCFTRVFRAGRISVFEYTRS